MKCNCCGAEISNDVRECPYCDAVVAKEGAEREVIYQEPIQTDVVEEMAEEVSTSQQSLVGKKYAFASVKGTTWGGIFNSKIISNVEIAEDRLFIDIKPKRLQTAPAILFEDITGIDITKKISFYYWILIIVSVLSGFAVPYFFALTLIFIFCGLQRKITISQRNGVKVVMYTSSASQAEEFKEDMKKVAKIH